MKDKNCLFTLIRGDHVRLAPGIKILPSEEFSELMSAQELISETKQDIKQWREEVAKEAEELKEASRKEGFQQGLQEWATKLEELEKEIARADKAASDKIIPVALKAAKKLLGRELEISKEAVVDIVMNNLRQVAHNKNVKIYVNREDLQVMDQNKEKIKKSFEKLESFIIVRSDEVKPGGALIETEGGIINAQLDNLIGALERAFESYIK